MFYGAQVWDPVLIIAQITAIQSLFYISLGILEWLVIGGYVRQLSLRHFFDWRALSLKSYKGGLTAVAHIVNGGAASLSLMIIVERAKKCLDFTVTCYIIHLVICSAHSGWPYNVEWWATNSLATALMALLGEWLCARREMQDIPLGSLRVRSTTSLLGSRLQHITTSAVGGGSRPAERGLNKTSRSGSALKLAAEV